MIMIIIHTLKSPEKQKNKTELTFHLRLPLKHSGLTLEYMEFFSKKSSGHTTRKSIVYTL